MLAFAIRPIKAGEEITVDYEKAFKTSLEGYGVKTS